MKKAKISALFFCVGLGFAGWSARASSVIGFVKGGATPLTPARDKCLEGVRGAKSLSFHQLEEQMEKRAVFVSLEGGALKWSEEWTANALHLLPQMNVRHYFSFGEILAELTEGRKWSNQLNPRPPLPADILQTFITAGSALLPRFTKDELLHVLGLIDYFSDTAPPESFIQAWRAASDNKRREFSKDERVIARLIFNRWGVKPRDLNSILQNGNNGDNGESHPVNGAIIEENKF